MKIFTSKKPTRKKKYDGIGYCVSVIEEVKVKFKKRCAWCEEKQKGTIYKEVLSSNYRMSRKRYICKQCAKTVKEARFFIKEIDSFKG